MDEGAHETATPDTTRFGTTSGMASTDNADRSLARESAVTHALSALLISGCLALAGCKALPPQTDTGAERGDLAAPQREASPLALSQPPDAWTALAGKRVRIAAPLWLAGRDERRPDSVLVSFDGPMWQPAERAAPGSDAAKAIAADNARRRLRLDGLSVAPALARARSGSRIEDVEGVVEATDAGIRLRLDRAPVLHAAGRPAPPTVPGNVRIAAFNLENFFNGDGKGGGFPTPRGARTPVEFQGQRDKLVQTIRGLTPDIAALMELENDGYGGDSALAQLVAALNEAEGSGRDVWRYVSPCGRSCAAGDRGPGDNPIRVGLIYNRTRVAPHRAPAVLQAGPFGPLSRVPLAQAFVALGTGKPQKSPPFVVVANHFKSKGGCAEAVAGDRDQGDGAACWNATRSDSARRLDAWLKTDPTRSGSERIVILGDLNAYAQESPLRELAALGWRDAFAVAGVEAPYSYVYDGQRGRLDHALLSPALAPHLRGAAEWHCNADEPSHAGYRDGGTGPWRSSDHDPLLLGFDIDP